MTENQRLKILFRELKFKTQAQFAEAIGLKPGSLSDILREKPGVKVSANTKNKLEKSYNVNIDWLETGKGEMFKTEETNVKPDMQNKIIARYEELLSLKDMEIMQLREQLQEYIQSKPKKNAS
jgi:transcriptional regulator with XRE-family HTH domain